MKKGRSWGKASLFCDGKASWEETKVGLLLFTSMDKIP